MNHNCFYSPDATRQIALWLVLVAPTDEGMARLSWPGWLVFWLSKLTHKQHTTLTNVYHLKLNLADAAPASKLMWLS